MAEEAKKKVKKEKIPRLPMPEQEPAVRARNFLEVPTGQKFFRGPYGVYA
jgi:hypothetical protein